MTNKTWPNLGPQDFLLKSSSFQKEWHKNYYVMFSSVWNAYSTSKEFWGIPPDDHMAHRGDGVFESFKCVDKRAYCLSEHLERLERSAKFLGIPLPPHYADTLDILKGAYRLGGHDDFVVRICISRGMGSFSVNPYDTHGPEYYLVTIKLKRPEPSAYETGVSAITSPFPAQTEFAGIKSCDYLHNVLVKKAAVDAGADYAVSFDPQGNLTESSTENVLILTKDRKLVAPPWNRILKGVTLTRVMAKGQELAQSGHIQGVENRDIRREELWDVMEEAFLTSTSFDLLPITKWDGKPVGDGKPGPVGKVLLKMMEEEIHSDNAHTTPLW